MRRPLVRRFTFFRSAAPLCPQGREFLPELGQFIGQLEHDLVLLGAVPLEVGITFLETGQAFNVTHA